MHAFQQAIEAASAACAGGRSLRMPSGAGHDAQVLATVMPAGMLFVPSIGGVATTGPRTPMMPTSSPVPRSSSTPAGDCWRGETEGRHGLLAPGRPLDQGYSAGVWVLGFVSMLMDVSSEMIHALLPIYLVTVLGASMVTVGVIEGIAEATASITKIFSGALSDRLGKRKWLAAAGYGLAAFTKPVFPLAPTIAWLVAARFVDRIGKGIRGAPRDALVADLSPADLRGASFGLRQSLDTVGAFRARCSPSP